MSVKLAFISGSVRSGSTNVMLAKLALKLARENGTDGDYIDLGDYPLPIYDGDLEAAEGVPENAL